MLTLHKKITVFFSVGYNIWANVPKTAAEEPGGYQCSILLLPNIEI